MPVSVLNTVIEITLRRPPLVNCYPPLYNRTLVAQTGLEPCKLVPVKGSSIQLRFINNTVGTLVLYMGLLLSEFSCCYFHFFEKEKNSRKSSMQKFAQEVSYIGSEGPKKEF